MNEKIVLDDEQDLMEHLRELRGGWSDEIPQEVIHSNALDNRYKVRRNWFTGVVADVANLLDEGTLKSEGSKKAAEKLLKRFTSKEFTSRELTTAKDIQTANRLIDVILGK